MAVLATVTVPPTELAFQSSLRLLLTSMVNAARSTPVSSNPRTTVKSWTPTLARTGIWNTTLKRWGPESILKRPGSRLNVEDPVAVVPVARFAIPKLGGTLALRVSAAAVPLTAEANGSDAIEIG